MKITIGSIQRKGRRLYLVARINGRRRWLTLKTENISVAKQRARLIIPAKDTEWDWLTHLATLGKQAEVELSRMKIATTLTWDNIADTFLAKCAYTVSEQSVDSYTRWLRILRKAANDTPPSNITKEQAEKITTFLSQGYVSCRRMVDFFRRCWKTVGLDETKWIAEPTMRRALIDAGSSHEFYRRLSTDEVKRLYSFTSVRNRELADMVAIGYYTGLRLSDVAELDTSEITADGSALKIVPNKTSRRKKRPLIIPLLDEAAKIISRRMPASSHNTDDGGDGCYLFSSAARHRPSRRISAAFRACAIRNVGNSRASFHSLRATFISLMDEAGVPPHLTDAITGHGGGGMHARYTQPSFLAMKDAMSRAIPPLNGPESSRPLEKREENAVAVPTAQQDGSDIVSGPRNNRAR